MTGLTSRQAAVVTFLGGAVVAGVLFVVGAKALENLGVPVGPTDGTTLTQPGVGVPRTSTTFDRSKLPPVTPSYALGSSSSTAPDGPPPFATPPPIIATLVPTTLPVDVPTTLPPTILPTEVPTTVPTTLEVTTTTLEVPTTVPTTIEVTTTSLPLELTTP